MVLYTKFDVYSCCLILAWFFAVSWKNDNKKQVRDRTVRYVE